MGAMMSVADIVDAMGGPTKFGTICGFEVNQASRGSDIRRRGSIPVEYWPQITAAARELGLPITNDTLVAAHTGQVTEPEERDVQPAA